MSLTEEQIEEIFELLGLASSKQREDFLSHLSFLAFNERLGSNDASWADDVIENDPPTEDTQ